MKTPDEIIPPLTKDQKRQVGEVEALIEAELRKRSGCRIIKTDFKDEETGKPIPEAVWEEVVTNAQNAGWDVSVEGFSVIINKPRR